MIKQFTNHGFKDQDRSVVLSGMDLFTSDNVNGVGKSAALEGFKLALLGEIPGRAKNLEDILLFTSRSRIELRVEAETSAGTVLIERQFLRNAVKGEKRPVRINQIVWKFEKGDQWIRDHLGAVSVSFDPYEFLNLSDSKKRQWMLSHSPESRLLTRDNLYSALVARVMEAYFGPGLVRSLLQEQGVANDLLSCPSPPKEELMTAFRQQDSARFCGVKEAMDRAFALWDESNAMEANVTAILTHLKSASQQLQMQTREAPPPTSEVENDFSGGDKPEFLLRETPADLNVKVHAAQENLKALEKTLEILRERIKDRADKLTRKEEIEERIRFSQEIIASLTEEFTDDSTDRRQEEILGLEEKIADPASLCEEVDVLNDELRELTEAYRKRKNIFQTLSDELKIKRRQLAAMKSSEFQCPVAAEIRCDTDMNPYRELLATHIEELRNRAKIERGRLEKMAEKVDICGKWVKEKQTELKKMLRLNESLREEINRLRDRIFAREKNRADARGRLKVHNQELESLIAERETLDEERAEDRGTLDEDSLEAQTGALEEDKREQTWLLTQLLREQGRQDALRESGEKKKADREKLETVKLLMRLLGPQGIQGELALRISQSLEDEVNECLKLIDADYDFTIDLTGKKFCMGWFRRGKVIPLTTINSAHFVLFTVPFLAAIINRLARVREKTGLPTLRALCIEAESMTPENLCRLLKGLSAIKKKGLLDNILVAHYHSLRTPEQLFGFREHVLREDTIRQSGCNQLTGGLAIDSQAVVTI